MKRIMTDVVASVAFRALVFAAVAVGTPILAEHPGWMEVVVNAAKAGGVTVSIEASDDKDQ